MKLCYYLEGRLPGPFKASLDQEIWIIMSLVTLDNFIKRSRFNGTHFSQ